MKHHTRSILSELQSFSASTPAKELIIEDRASHAIAEATDIIQAIHHNFDDAIAQDLEKRFINNEKKISNDKLILLKLISNVLKSGMYIVGVSTPKKM